ncbi:DUF2312 domain-containing protein [Parvibaculaceae bacterium PLY_AMNH_Bact1]|nr:DUF2312 domain-containing protein [Parvibaculaceae bacterium PLY_AMNH_Bact1]
MSGIGHNLPNAKLRKFFERLERLQDEIDALNGDKSELYAEAKAMGFDPKIMRIVFSRRQQDTAELQEKDAKIALYEEALSGVKKKTGTERATRARARGGDDADAS